MWRELDPKDEEPLVIDGHVVPSGTQVCVSLYCLHHNDAYFEESFNFMPERWLVDPTDSEEEVARKRLAKEAFVPFSVGTRNCAGRSMAYLEASLAIAKTLWHCDLERPMGAADTVGAGGPGKGAGREREMEFQLLDTFIASHDGPNLIIRPRQFSEQLDK